MTFGLSFGFVLQKGGVGKFNLLIGQLLLQERTVAKIMLTPIIVLWLESLPFTTSPK
jgi:uncharacterized protein